MCGIAGKYTEKIIDRAKLKSEVEKMIDGLSHRGPDSTGIEITGEKICIGNSRLSFVDLLTGEQPITNNGLSIVFNGEIYNYKALRSQLLGKYNFKTNTDKEVILQGYKKFGLNVFSQLNGMFSVCIVD